MKVFTKVVLAGVVALGVGAAYEQNHPTQGAGTVYRTADSVHIGSNHSYNVETGVDVFTRRPACRITPDSTAESKAWTQRTGFSTAGFLGGDFHIYQVEGPRVDNPSAAETLCNTAARLTPGRTGTYIME